MSFHRSPLGLKEPRPSKAEGRAHMARVAALPCVLCGNPQVTVHHVISGRYSQRKAPDTMVLPLCWNHHQGPEGIHTDKRAWEARFGPDTDYLPVVADALAGELTPIKGRVK